MSRFAAQTPGTRGAGLLVLVASVLISFSASADVHGQRRALVVHGKDESFNREAAAFAAAARARGYETTMLNVWSLASHEEVLQTIDSETSLLKRGDRLLLTFNCHGGGLRDEVYLDPEEVRVHKSCRMTSGDTEDIVNRLVQRGVEVIVFDNSCGGGSTVELLERDHVCAIASVAPGLPSLTGFPSFSRVLRDSGLAHTFEDVALEGQFEIFHRMPDRLGQKAYYSTQSGLARSEAVFRAAFLHAAASLSKWQLRGSPIYGALYSDEGVSAPDEDEPQPMKRKTIDQLLKRSERLSDVLNQTMAVVVSQWNDSKGMSGGGTKAALFKAAVAAYRERDLIEPGMELPSSIDSLHERLRAEVEGAQKRRARLAQLVDAWQRHSAEVGDIEEIKQIQQEVRAHNASVSVLMGISEFVDTKLDASPCRVGI